MTAARPAAVSEPADLAALFQRRHLELVRLATLLVGDQASAEDVVQDVFTRLHARETPTDGRDLLPYIRAAVVNGCWSQLRRRTTAQRVLGHYASHFRPVPQDSAEQEILKSEERKEVLDALASLSKRRQEVLILRYYLELSEAEIARVLGIAPGTVKSTAARGLEALAKKLGGKK